MARRRSLLGLRAASTLAGLVWLVPGAGASSLDAGSLLPFEPPLALPQQINGVLRASQQAEGRARIDRIRDVFLAVRACWRPPAGGPTGQQVTVRVSFKRTGEVLGRPQITFYQAGGGDAEARRRFTDSVVAALGRCTPLPFTESFGGAIAGRPFTFRFIDDRPI